MSSVSEREATCVVFIQHKLQKMWSLPSIRHITKTNSACVNSLSQREPIGTVRYRYNQHHQTRPGPSLPFDLRTMFSRKVF